MRRLSVLALAVVALFAVALVAQAAEEAKELSGTVTFVCPQHKAIKVKCSGGKAWTPWVDLGADNASSIQERVKQLKVDDSVTVRFEVRDGRNYIRELKKTQWTLPRTAAFRTYCPGQLGARLRS